MTEAPLDTLETRLARIEAMLEDVKDAQRDVRGYFASVELMFVDLRALIESRERFLAQIERRIEP